jgi:hypothetical protein
VSDTFKVGEIAILQNGSVYIELNETECEIIGGLEMRKGRDPVTFQSTAGEMYLIRAVNNKVLNVYPRNLRKKRPPQQYSGELRIRELFDQSTVEQLVPAEIA